MKGSGILGVMLLLLIACQHVAEVKKPKKLIEEAQLIEILTDLAIYSAAKSQDRILVESKNIDIYHHLSEKHKIDTTVLRENINYYASDIARYTSIQEAVKSALEKQKKDYDALNKKEDAKRKAKMEKARKKLQSANDSVFRPKLQQLKAASANN
jgi:GTPase involved in cell partitioning and DNA repair